MASCVKMIRFDQTVTFEGLGHGSVMASYLKQNRHFCKIYLLRILWGFLLWIKEADIVRKLEMYSLLSINYLIYPLQLCKECVNVFFSACRNQGSQRVTHTVNGSAGILSLCSFSYTPCLSCLFAKQTMENTAHISNADTEVYSSIHSRVHRLSHTALSPSYVI